MLLGRVFHFGSPVFKSCVCGHCLVTLFLTVNDNIKMALIVAAHLNAGIILVVTV